MENSQLIVRRILQPSSAEKKIYLTFDDGPDEFSTAKVLDLLAEQNVRATFFVVAHQAKKNFPLFRRAISEGHGIGNHSLDHTYHRLFRGKSVLKAWVEDAEKLLADGLGEATVGFRPPVGILTPELRRALHELRMPIIYWDIRFYDGIFAWNAKRALRSLQKTHSGSIVLLHDRQPLLKTPLFLSTLRQYLAQLEENKYHCHPLTRELIEQSARID